MRVERTVISYIVIVLRLASSKLHGQGGRGYMGLFGQGMCQRCVSYSCKLTT